MQMGDGQNVFDFLYVGNLVHAHLLAARTLIRASKEEVVYGERVDGEAFHVTNDEPWLFWDFIRAIAAEAGYPVREEEVRAIPRWLGMLLAFFGEWWVWIVSFGKRESGLTRYGVRYSTLNRTLDAEKAKRVLGYRPIFTMREGIERSVRWAREREKQV
jgi:sterol-4alpha-carboxylate 3-dehydrogenase (decarboxylating)